MSRDRRGVTIIDLPASRRETPNLIDMIWWRHWVYGLVEADITTPRTLIREYESWSDEQLSFTGYLAYCLGRAVREDRMVHAMRKGRRQLAVLEDVDILVMIERQVRDVRAPTGHVIRQTDRRPYLEISREIREVQARPVSRTKSDAAARPSAHAATRPRRQAVRFPAAALCAIRPRADGQPGRN